MADQENQAPAAIVPPRPSPSQQEIQKYIDGAMRRFEDSPEGLEPFEKRLLAKIRKASGAAQQAMKDVQDLKGQITQAEARLRSVELQAESHQGAINAYIDEVVTQKFGIEEPIHPTAPESAPAPLNRHEKRAAKAKGDKQET